MRKLPSVPLVLLSLLALAAGCHSDRSARRSHHDTPGSFTDQSARSVYVDRRVKELTEKGVSEGDAAARASREWFARAPVASETPTYQERKRRAAQSDFESDLARQKEESSR